MKMRGIEIYLDMLKVTCINLRLVTARDCEEVGIDFEQIRPVEEGTILLYK